MDKNPEKAEASLHEIRMFKVLSGNPQSWFTSKELAELQKRFTTREVPSIRECNAREKGIVVNRWLRAGDFVMHRNGLGYTTVMHLAHSHLLYITVSS